ncbi:MAG: TetR/AcrR family transcriptional regulator [bacterium]
MPLQSNQLNQSSPVASYKTFCQQLQPTEQQLYSLLYKLHEKQFSVKNERLAVIKLQKIFEATFKLANAHGFQAMTLRQLASETHMSMGGLYAYISSKDDIVTLIFSFLNQFCSSRIQNLVDDTLPPDQKIRALIRIHIYFSEMMHPWFYFAYMETKNLSKEHRHMAVEAEYNMENRIANCIEAGIKTQQFKIDNSLLAAALVKALLQDWYLKRWKYNKRNIHIDDYSHEVEQMTLAYLLQD